MQEVVPDKETPKQEPKNGKSEAKGSVVRSVPLPTRDDGSFALKTLQEQLAFAERLMTERMVSESFQNPTQVVLGIQYAKAMKMDVLLAFKMMYVIDGKVHLYGDGPLALCQRSGEMGDIKEFFFDKDFKEICFDNKNLDDDVYGSCTRVWRIGQPNVQEDTFTLKDLEKAGMNMSKHGEKVVWKKYQRIMMRYKARSLALKSKFADLISGINVAEWDSHFTPEVPEGRGSSLAKEIEKQYGEEKTTTVEGKE